MRSNENLGCVGVEKVNYLEQCKVWISRQLTTFFMFNRHIINMFTSGKKFSWIFVDSRNRCKEEKNRKIFLFVNFRLAVNMPLLQLSIYTLKNN
jgi:hypothetical protein